MTSNPRAGDDITAQNVHTLLEVNRAATMLGKLWSRWLPEHDFTEVVFKPMLADKTTSAEALILELRSLEDVQEAAPGEPLTPETRSGAIALGTMLIACAYCVQALRAGAYPTVAQTWTADAHRWTGILMGMHMNRGGFDLASRAASQLGRKGAGARHAEHRAMKIDVMKWCDENMAAFGSVDAAAAAVAGGVVPVVFRTAADWIREWKKLQSGGRP